MAAVSSAAMAGACAACAASSCCCHHCACTREIYEAICAITPLEWGLAVLMIFLVMCGILWFIGRC